MPAVMDPESLAVIEPRIRYLAREIRRLLSLVELEKDGQPVEVDGFRLRELSQWCDNQAASALDAILPISGRCNSRCAFCFEQNVPFVRDTSFMDESEAYTRLRHYSPQTGACLFPSNRPEMETFLHPRAVAILQAARQRDEKNLFCITTNGSCLDDATVEQLARLKPLLIKLSLNVADEGLHRELMGLGRRTQTALEAPERLRRHGIAFVGGLVAWPTLSLEAIEETVRFLEQHEAYAIRIRLPLVHRWVREKPDVDWEEHWARVSGFCRTLGCRVPLFVEPTVYSTTPIVARIDGVILNSPAYRAGVQANDVVEAINGQRVLTRNESRAILLHAQQSACGVVLEVNRRGRKLQFRLQPQTQADYPYDPDLPYRGNAYGVFHTDDFRLKHLVDVFGAIDRHRAKKVLLFSSPLVAPVFEMLTRKIPEFVEARKRMTLLVEPLETSRLGGNFTLLEGRFVEDYARTIRRRLQTDPDIDLILIPCGFGSAWGTDPDGESVRRLVLEFGIDVELIDWHFVYGRDD